MIEGVETTVVLSSEQYDALINQLVSLQEQITELYTLIAYIFILLCIFAAYNFLSSIFGRA